MEEARRDFVKGMTAAAAVAAMAKAWAPGPADAASPVYEIYAAKYAGPFTSKLAFLLFNQGWDQDIDRYYYIWAVKGDNGDVTLVDTGVGVTTAGEKKLRGYVNPVDVLKRIGVDAGNVTKVVITHMHWDHVGGMEMFPKAFPKATFYVQKKEYDFWVKHPVAKRPFMKGFADARANAAVSELEGSSRLVLVQGDLNIGPGLDIVYAPGHTVALQSLAVTTAKGTAIVASDCGHLARNFKEDHPSSLITDLIAWLETYDKLRKRASSVDLLFPGHDALMLTSYPRVAEDVTRLV
jgi:glyoxylase-like metal-dependent hydrolase (beta-lactamase superfamily II)